MPEDGFINRNGWTVAFISRFSKLILQSGNSTTTKKDQKSKLVPVIWSTAILVRFRELLAIKKTNVPRRLVTVCCVVERTSRILKNKKCRNDHDQSVPRDKIKQGGLSLKRRKEKWLQSSYSGKGSMVLSLD